MACPAELLQKRDCPFFKRRSLFTPYADELRRTDGCAAGELYRYVKAHTEFPVDLLLASLLQTQPMAALAKNLHWNYVIAEPAAEVPDLAALGLRLLRYTLPAADPVTDWYNKKASADADALLGRAAQLFEKKPLLGVLSPALPLWQGCAAARRTQWQRDAWTLAEKAAVPVGSDPLPAPNCGWLLVREASFLDGIPPCTTQCDAWQLALTAQAAGYYAAAFETAAQAAARADVLDVYEADAARPAAVAKHLGRLIKHKLQK